MLVKEARFKGYSLVIMGIILIAIVTPLMIINIGPAGCWFIACGLLFFVAAFASFYAATATEKKLTGKITRKPNLHDELLGMATSPRGIDLQYLAKAFKISVEAARTKVFDLIQNGQLSGTLAENENVFRPTGDFPQIVDVLILELQK